MQNVMVVGAGFMGAGIGQVCAQAGYRVFLMDTKPEGLEKAFGNIKWSVEKFASKGFLKESPGTILERISLETDGRWIEAVFFVSGARSEAERGGSLRGQLDARESGVGAVLSLVEGDVVVAHERPARPVERRGERRFARPGPSEEGDGSSGERRGAGVEDEPASLPEQDA